MRIHFRQAVTVGVSLSLFCLVYVVSRLTAPYIFDENDAEYFMEESFPKTTTTQVTSRTVKFRYPNGSNLNSVLKTTVPVKIFSTPPAQPWMVFRPGSKGTAHLWPNNGGDRILHQIKHIPSGYSRRDAKVKVIFVPEGLDNTPKGQEKFIAEECLVDSCMLTIDWKEAKTADAILLGQTGIPNDIQKQPGQIWILYILESPLHVTIGENLKDKINWTATYRLDSTIVTPYEKFVPFPNASSVMSLPVPRNYAEGKTKMVAWFVTNCYANNQRGELVEELQQYINVDIYGGCGMHQCPRYERERCNQILNADYKFYLSFENSNCVDYITEKFYWNALW